jgi:hypothetical protein
MAKKEPLIIPKFLMKFSSTYFKRASENSLQPPKTEKIKDKIIDKPEEKPKDHISLRKKFQKKHGRSSSEIDYEKLLRAGKKISTSSIYDLLNNRLTDHTLNTQINPTTENYAITIPTEVEEEIRGKKVPPRISHSPLEVITFFSSEANNNPNEKLIKPNNFLQALSEEESKKNERGFNKSVSPNIIAPYTDKDPFQTQQELGLFHTRSRSLQLVSVLKEESFIKTPADTMQVVYTPSGAEIKKLSEEKQLENNLDRSVVNCLICFDKAPDAVFMECGHGGLFLIIF